MNSIPYIDIHTHSAEKWAGIISVRNIFPGEKIEVFSGRNFYSVGLHPWKIKTKMLNNQDLLIVEEALEFDHLIFVGECGLDKNIKNFEEQKRVFTAQAFMAEEFRKPLLIHCVGAYYELVGLHNKLHPEMPWILHGYNGNIQITRQLLTRNILFSFGKNLLDPKAKAIESFEQLPLNKIFFETDEFRGQVGQIFNRGATIKNISVDEIKKAVWQNFNRIENISINLS